MSWQYKLEGVSMSMHNADPFTRAFRFAAELASGALLLGALYAWCAWTSVASRINRRYPGGEAGR